MRSWKDFGRRSPSNLINCNPAHSENGALSSLLVRMSAYQRFILSRGFGKLLKLHLDILCPTISRIRILFPSTTTTSPTWGIFCSVVIKNPPRVSYSGDSGITIVMVFL